MNTSKQSLLTSWKTGNLKVLAWQQPVYQSQEQPCNKTCCHGNKAQWPFSWETRQTWMFPWKQSQLLIIQPLTFLGYRRSCQWRRWSPCCLSSPGSECRMPGCRSVATDDAGWSDGPWETDLCRKRWRRHSLGRLTVPSTDSVQSLLLLESNQTL